MSKDHDPAKFWREQSIYHQERANFWSKTSRILMGILAGIIVVTAIAMKVSA